MRELQVEHGFSGEEVEAITVTGTARMVERHNILEPADLMLAQYSIPFCVALALHREARDPESFDETALRDPQIRRRELRHNGVDHFKLAAHSVGHCLALLYLTARDRQGVMILWTFVSSIRCSVDRTGN